MIKISTLVSRQEYQTPIYRAQCTPYIIDPAAQHGTTHNHYHLFPQLSNPRFCPFSPWGLQPAHGCDDTPAREDTMKQADKNILAMCKIIEDLRKHINEPSRQVSTAANQKIQAEFQHVRDYYEKAKTVITGYQIRNALPHGLTSRPTMRDALAAEFFTLLCRKVRVKTLNNSCLWYYNL